jgi:hypothetical protein
MGAYRRTAQIARPYSGRSLAHDEWRGRDGVTIEEAASGFE